MNKAPRFKVECQECGRKFWTTKALPVCPKCGGSDVELAVQEDPGYDRAAWLAGKNGTTDQGISGFPKRAVNTNTEETR